MVRATLSVVLLLAITALAVPAPLPQLPDPAQEKNVGNGQGRQFIGGQCLSSADCNSRDTNTCCATLGDIGVCSAASVAGTPAKPVQGKTGCGFGDGVGGAVPGPSTTPVTGADGANGGRPAPTEAAGSNAGADEAVGGAGGENPNVGSGNGQQFITGECFSDADCASGCCSPTSQDRIKAACAARLVAEETRGCGFVKLS
ncbi:hypothetical protein DL766_007362 [Monosporascus sp. MC13-8B]|uniref:Biotrophy-associated secreted protein 2 n=1 Tax=Monosporascus cannonballus TaxID=155416 RepID=A0ABY0GZG6_9PEZI|nr:hypothetical protein DL762_007617 [Monosporascus cannonballus]RYO85231.1 hypothetical protein DL763_007172 [Monosporascus cannonballus]RYP24105.1 hypothetical protein DL766_007362 [Monosporascus sp. MC13-8B]